MRLQNQHDEIIENTYLFIQALDLLQVSPEITKHGPHIDRWAEYKRSDHKDYKTKLHEVPYSLMIWDKTHWGHLDQKSPL
jgi:hypothetical protein